MITAYKIIEMLEEHTLTRGMNANQIIAYCMRWYTDFSSAKEAIEKVFEDPTPKEQERLEDVYDVLKDHYEEDTKFNF